MPKRLERCVEKVKKTVTPKGDRTATESAWAICKANLQKRTKGYKVD
jgi:hypothetical protein